MLFPGSYKHSIFSRKLSRISTALSACRKANNKMIIHYYVHCKEISHTWDALHRNRKRQKKPHEFAIFRFAGVNNGEI